MNIRIDCARDLGPLPHFWNSTGFSPGELLLTADMRQQMTYTASIPHGGLAYVRPHFLLELAGLQGLATGSPTYDWSRLDTSVDIVVSSGCKLIFELMGNPNGAFSDFRDDRQLHAWRDLVSALARHCIDRYGQAEVESWYFEAWNEPDGRGWWQQWPDDIISFCNYYDACSEGLREADSRLRLGGPGTCITMSPLFQAFLTHCDTGTNYFTRETGVRLDFISVHEKGIRSSIEDLNPRTTALLEREIRAIEHIRQHHPRFADTPFMNNECDPQVGWGDFHTWHARPYYAAIVCKIINQHLVGLIDGLTCPYRLLSSDNGFIGRWGNRTLLARFGPAQPFDDGQSHHKAALLPGAAIPAQPFEMIKKPILNVMAALSLLGDRRCASDGASDINSDVGIIASRRGSDQIAILVYHSRDRIVACGSEHIRLMLQHLPFEHAVLAHYRIDEGHGDPYAIWEEMGGLPEPGPGMFAAMREGQELALLAPPREVTIGDCSLVVEFNLPLPGVSLFLLSAKPADAPEQVRNVCLARYVGLHGEAQMMVSWQGVSSRTIRTYEVLRADQPDGPFVRVNTPDLICTAFLDVREANAPSGFYRVSAIDFWGRRGPESEPASSI
jgi:L-iduronidase